MQLPAPKAVLLLLPLLVAVCNAQGGTGDMRPRPPSNETCSRPQFSANCPSAGCAAPVSYVTSGSGCCPSSSPYGGACSAECLGARLACLPCAMNCMRGCKRDVCGAPKGAGNQCCTPLGNCTNANIYLDAECCPACHSGSTAKPANPAYCRADKPNGVGRPKCGSKGCKLEYVPPGSDRPQFDFQKLTLVCKRADMDVVRSAADALHTALGGRLGSLSLTNIAGSLSSVTQKQQSIDNFNAAVMRIRDANCRRPLNCMAEAVRATRGLCVTVANALRPYTDGSMTSAQLQAAITTLQTSFTNLAQSFANAMANGGKCSAKLYEVGACAQKAQKVNIMDLLANTKCTGADLKCNVVRKLVEWMENKTQGGGVPKPDTMPSFPCADVGPCLLDLFQKFNRRLSQGCGDKQLKLRGRGHLGRLLKQCASLGSLSGTTLQVAMQQCLLDGKDYDSVPAANVKAAVSPMARLQMQSNCPDVAKRAERRIRGSLSLSTKADVLGYPTALGCADFNDVPQSVLDAMTCAEKTTMATKLASDRCRKQKCQALVRKTVTDAATAACLPQCMCQLPITDLRNFGQSIKTTLTSNCNSAGGRSGSQKKGELRELFQGDRLTTANFNTNLQVAFCLPVSQIDDAVCTDDAKFQSISQSFPNTPLARHCADKRPAVTSMSGLLSLGARACKQMPPKKLIGALSGSPSLDDLRSAVTGIFDDEESDAGSSEPPLSNRQKTRNKRCILRMICKKLRDTLTDVTAAEGISIACMTAQDLVSVNCTDMLTMASNAAPYIRMVNRGLGSKVVKCVCQEYGSDCSSIDATGLEQLGAFVIFMSAAQINALPASTLPTFCSQLMAVDVAVMARKMQLPAMQAAATRCLTVVDLSSSGAGSSVDLSSVSAFNESILESVPMCGLSASDLIKLDYDSVLQVLSNMKVCPYDGRWHKAICDRYFGLMNAGNSSYSVEDCFPCAKFFGDSNVQATKLIAADISSNAGNIQDFEDEKEKNCNAQKDEGLPCGSDVAGDVAAKSKPAMEKALGGGSSSGRRRRRAVTSVTCTDVQNFGSGIGAISLAQLNAMTDAEFHKCFSAFGLANTAWSSELCGALKTKTQNLYGAPSAWNATVLLSVNCLTQCWSAAEIQNIMYSEVAHISDIGTYCSKMPAASLASIIAAYITKARSGNAAQMTLTEIGSMGHLTCGATTSHVGSFSDSHVVNSLSSLGAAGPCSEALMQAYVARVKINLGGTVTSWDVSYITSLGNLLGGLTNTEFASLTTAQLASIDPSAIPSLPPSRLASLSVSQLSELSDSQKSAITSTQLAAMSPEQRAAVGAPAAAGATIASTTLVAAAALFVWSLQQQQ